MKFSPERFLEKIYALSNKGEDEVKSVDVGKALSLNRPDVFRALKAVKVFGYVDQKPYGKIILTEKGKDKAQQVIKIHKILTGILQEHLELSEKESLGIAYDITNIMSDKAINRIIEKFEEK